FKAKRIVLYDTLIKGYSISENKDDDKEKISEAESTLTHRKTNDVQQTNKKKAEKGCEPEEVLAVLCHEFGHWSLSHNLINLCISFVSL
ncbi:unnamed protein product, partial [Rotaria magnacalcarata]